MNDDYKIPKSLKDALQAGNVVPFVGAGVSMSVKKKNDNGTESKESLFPSWKGFVEILAQALRDENKPDEADFVLSSIKIKKPKYLDALQHAQEQLGKGLWYKYFDKSFDIPESNAHPDSFKLNKLVWELANNLIITTNVDRVFQWTCPRPSEFTILDVQNVEYAQLQKEKFPKDPTVWHLHGHIKNKEKVIFTREQFESFYKKHGNEAKLQTLLNFLTNRTFLFIGFSLDDDYLRELLEYIHNIYKGGADSYYILFRERDIATANFPEYITPIPFSEFGKPLEDLVAELSRIAREKDGEKKEQLQTEIQQPKMLTEKDRLKNHFNVPFASKGDGFVGRVGKIEEIWESLNKGRRAAIGQAVAIEGFGGLGKTQLAVEYANAYREKYENGVYWLTADEDMSVQLIKIGESLHWISQSDTGFDQAKLVRNRFRRLSDCLIIFDNVDDQNAIKDYLPEANYHPHILVTSREEQNGFHPINLDTLSEDEARKMLVQIAGRSPKSELEEKALENILTELDGLPLAVELVGGYLLRRKATSFQDYFEFLESESIDRIEDKFRDNPFSKRDKSIIRALKISEKLLNETEYLEDVLDILVWSGKSSMGYSLLQKLIGTDDNLALKDALGVALELHFIKKEENEERYAIHRLLAKVRQFEKPLKERKEWHQGIVGKLVEWFRQRKNEFEFLKEFEAEIIHLQQWQSQSSDILPIESVYLNNFEAYPLWHRGNYQESRILLEKALELYQRNDLNDGKLLSNLYNDLGVIIGNWGDIQKSFEYQKEALSIGQTVFNEKSADTAKFLSNLGAIFGALGNHQKALELQQQALEIRRELFGEKHPAVALSLHWLGFIHGEANNFKEAELFLNQALRLNQEILGNYHPTTIRNCRNLIDELIENGKQEKAGRLAGEFLSYVPKDNSDRPIFEKYGAMYRKAKQRKKKRRH